MDSKESIIKSEHPGKVHPDKVAQGSKHPGRVAQGHRLVALNKQRKEELLKKKDSELHTEQHVELHTEQHTELHTKLSNYSLWGLFIILTGVGITYLYITRPVNRLSQALEPKVALKGDDFFKMR